MESPQVVQGVSSLIPHTAFCEPLRFEWFSSYRYHKHFSNDPEDGTRRTSPLESFGKYSEKARMHQAFHNLRIHTQFFDDLLWEAGASFLRYLAEIDR